MPPLILASASPQRRRLLGRLGLAFDIEERIATYIASGEPMDKAGAYAIQGAGGALVLEIEGRLDTVVGLPLDLVATLLGVDPV